MKNFNENDAQTICETIVVIVIIFALTYMFTH